MNSIIHCAEPNTRCRFVQIRVPAVEQNGYMVVPVKENYRSLVDNEKERVNELREFRVNKKVNFLQAQTTISAKQFKK